MKVMQILRLKGSSAVECVAPEATVAEAVARLSRLRIGAVVVTTPEGEVAGIISERDIVRAIGADGPSALERRVSELMTRRVETCGPEDDGNAVLARMSAGRFRHMPVMVRGRLAGLLSIGDVVKARIGEIEAENAAMAQMLAG